MCVSLYFWSSCWTTVLTILFSHEDNDTYVVFLVFLLSCCFHNSSQLGTWQRMHHHLPSVLVFTTLFNQEDDDVCIVIFLVFLLCYYFHNSSQLKKWRHARHHFLGFLALLLPSQVFSTKKMMMCTYLRSCLPLPTRILGPSCNIHIHT